MSLAAPYLFMSPHSQLQLPSVTQRQFHFSLSYKLDSEIYVIRSELLYTLDVKLPQTVNYRISLVKFDVGIITNRNGQCNILFVFDIMKI